MIQFNDALPSTMKYWPTESDPQGRYKYSSVYLLLSQDKTFIERQTYSALEWLGDIGGLFDALYILGSVFVAPLTHFVLQTALHVNVFKKRPSDEDDDSDAGGKGNLVYRD